MGARRGKASRQVGPFGRPSELLPKRPSVAADGGPDPWDDDPGFDDGSAGVREPRRPKPPGPLSAAAELPEPEPPTYLTLSDARR